MGSSWITYAIGFLAQGFFSARILVQWVMSERARKVLSPSIFWILSIAGSYLLFIYGWLRDDFAILFGQFISYYIYLWNLDSKGVWHRIPWLMRMVLILTPVVAVCFVAGSAGAFVQKFFQNDKVPMWLLLYGSAGQVLFTFRFIYQWFYSRAAGESTLPAGFWIISLLGSVSIVTYGIIRLDPVLIVGQSFGMVAYVRNLMILSKERTRKQS